MKTCIKNLKNYKTNSFNKISLKSTSNSTTRDHHNTFYADELEIIKTTKPLQKPDLSKPLKFGLHNTDYLFEVDYDEEHGGWQKPLISPYHKLEIDPKNSSLHYAIQLFEGMKAFKSYKNKNDIILFRPEMNMKRMLNSAKRIGLNVKLNK